MAIVTVPPTQLDIAVAKTIAAHTGPRIERTAQLLTWGADEHILCALAAGWWLFCRSKGAAKRHASDHILVTTLVASALPHILKAVFDQERPDRTTIRGHWRGIPFSGKRLDAFPSGHAVHIGALASAASVLPPKQRNLAWGLGGALVLTRIVLLAHWFSDVAAGLVLGSVTERLIRQLTGYGRSGKTPNCCETDQRYLRKVRALSVHILLTPSRSTFAVMIARPGRPGIHDGTEFALQGFKNPVGEAAAIAFFEFLPRHLTGGIPLRTSIWGKDTTEFVSAFLNGGALAIPPTTASVELPLARANRRCCSRTLIAEGLSEILGTMFIAADCLDMNTKEDAMDLNGKKIAILATNGFEQAELEVPRDRLEKAGATVDVVSLAGGEIKGWDRKDWGRPVKVDKTLDEVSAKDYDAVVLPGGQINPDLLRVEPKALKFIKDIFEAKKVVAAVCHAPWLLIETGIAKGRKMTSFKSIKTDVANAGAKWEDSEVVVDQGVITSRNPGDLEAFSAKIIEEVKEGRHTQRSAA